MSAGLPRHPYKAALIKQNKSGRFYSTHKVVSKTGNIYSQEQSILQWKTEGKWMFSTKGYKYGHKATELYVSHNWKMKDEDFLFYHY